MVTPPDPLEFWQRVHKRRIRHWVTATPGPVIAAALEVTDRLTTSSVLRVLEIGVGHGTMVAYLLAQGYAVTGVDLSPRALRRLPAGVARVQTAALPDVPTASHDLALSFLCVQHCDDAMVAFLLRHAVRIAGECRFQMADRDDSAHRVYTHGAPFYVRPLAHVAALVPELTLTRLARVPQPHHASNPHLVWELVVARPNSVDEIGDSA